MGLFPWPMAKNKPAQRHASDTLEQCAIRVEKEMLAEIDQYAASLRVKNAGLEVSRSNAIRMLLRRALDSI